MMSPKIPSTFRPLMLWLLVSVLFISGCNLFTSSEERLQKAVKDREKGQLNAAAIELKNVLKSDPENVKARWLLGRTYLDMHDGPSAKKELLRAKSLGKTDTEVNIALVQALLLTNEAEAALKLLDETSGFEADAQALALRGEAELSLKRPDAARKSFIASLAADPKFVKARYGLIQLAIVDRAYEKAAEQIGKVLEENPDDFQGLIYQAELALEQGDREQAIETYKHALTLGDSLFARLGMARAYLVAGKTAEAEAQLEIVLKRDPESIAGRYLQAVAEHQRNDLASAKTNLLELLSKAPNHYPSMLLLGSIQYNLGEYEQAVDNLTSYLAQEPSQVSAMKLLAQSYLKLGDLDSAIKWLESASKNAPDDPGLMSMLGNLYTRKGEYSKGETYYDEALKLSPDAKDVKTRMALNRWAAGDQDQAIAALTAIADSDKAYVPADLALISAHMKSKEFDKALEAAKKLIDKQPTYPVAYALAAAASEGMGKRVQARSYIEQSLSTDAKYVNGYLMQARLDLADKKPEQAKLHLQAGLRAKPDDERLLLMLARIEGQQGHPDKARELVEQARTKNPDALAPRVLLATAALRKADYERARGLIQEALEIAPDNAKLLMLKAQTEQAAGDINAALSVYDKLLEHHPKVLEAYLKRGLLQEGKGDVGAARESFEQVLKLDAENLPAQVALGKLDLKAGHAERAQATAEKLKRKWADKAAGYFLMGDVLMSRNKPLEAVAEYRKAYEMAADRWSMLRLSQALQAAGKDKASVALMKQWLDKHPKDLGVLVSYAGRLQGQGENDAAVRAYNQVLQQRPGNVVAMNNLAWLYLQQGRSAEALKLGKKAYELASASPDVIDTYGWILINSNQVAEGLKLLEMAVSKKRKDLVIRYHLAVAYARSGKSALAKSELEDILASNSAFSERDAARKLLESLQ